jgi:hypothetical protein
MAVLTRNWLRILIWAVVLGVLASLVADWGEWDRFLVNMLWRVMIVAAGGLAGLLLNYFAGGYVTMGTNVIESMGITRFGSDADRKIENSFVFVCSLAAAVIAAIFIT